MSVSSSVIAAVSFVWLGMVLAISFLEAPLKFRAPGVSLRLGLGIGRVVFRALNRVELLLALLLLGALVRGPQPVTTVVAVVLVAVVLAAQLLVVRPRLNRRSDRALAGEELPRSRVHHAYVVLEVAKLAGLVLAGVGALSALAAT